MCCYLDDIIKIEDFDCNNILIDEKLYKNSLVYNVVCDLVYFFKNECI